MDKLANTNRAKVIDVLAERLTFERAGVKIYDTILEKMKKSNDPHVMRMFEEMERHRREEKEHEEWLEQQIRSLGGDAHELTEKAKLVQKESMGIEQVIEADPEISHLFHALMAAELVDHAGWDLLVQLADDADDSNARRAFKKRLDEEEEHLIFVRKALERFARREVLGERAKLPARE